MLGRIHPARSRAARLLVVLVAGLLASGLGAFWAGRDGSQPARADDSPLLVAPTTTTSTTVPPEPAVQVSRPEGPVHVPSNAYAPEPIVKIGTLEIPKIGLNTPIYHGITMRNIDLGPSHWPGTPMPGENGNTVFPGHRVTKTRPFRNIDQLRPGDLAIFTVNGVRSTYVMTGNQIVKPTQMEIIDPTPTPTATIVACHPPGSARQRFVVKFALVQE
ncbi:MAG: sortase [Actinomycetota bacterium]|jgi:sortase A